ncbi:hypothetical protein N5P37_006410 [Trichoderma harzianum]|uniref:Uncharacterized protein n=1 Tax=Trichoderma harzianum CBS 226.95 TaxID=983964 RepID=A0A2T4A9X7_TRIHA|nr:hypothetical protein M431DRAFT_6014 [Trichoderma harzianum CBS 226.95]KAK0761458.1 hypothetical protein N5P37_006410 [Trichoderma harzianum]PTB53718.1 hypothetical protein M431DRAFT_6014 [Trichoderma harzianum CBS 226.95]
MAGAWSFVSFSIESTTPDRLTDILFANGLMQVPVVISILARYKENVEHKNIAASVREPSGDDAHTGVTSSFNSRVIITSVAPPRVTIDDVETTRSPESFTAWIDNP